MEFFLAIVKCILFTRYFKTVLDGIKGVSLQVCTFSKNIWQRIFALSVNSDRGYLH